MRLVKAVLFDLDGTLVDSLPELYHGVHTVLSDMGLKAPSQEAVGAMIGRGILVLVQRLCAALGIAVESEQGRDLFDRLLKAWSESGGRHMAFYLGVIEGVEQLKDKGIRVALVTNKQRSLTVEFLQSRGLESLFDTVVAGDDCPNNKPAPDMLIRAMTEMNVCASETVMVGDSRNDALAGRAAGVSVALVETGYNEGVSIADWAREAGFTRVYPSARKVCERIVASGRL